MMLMSVYPLHNIMLCNETNAYEALNYREGEKIMKRVQMFVGTGIGEYWKKLLSIPEKLVVDSKVAESVISDTLLANGIKGFTLEHTIGYWEGTKENSFVITIYTDVVSPKKWYEIAVKIGNQLYQDSIMLDEDGDVHFIDSTEVAR